MNWLNLQIENTFYNTFIDENNQVSKIEFKAVPGHLLDQAYKYYYRLPLNEKDRSKIVILENKNDAEYWITNYYIDKKIYDEEFKKNGYFKINKRSPLYICNKI